MKNDETAKRSSFMRRFLEYRVVFVPRVLLVFSVWILTSALVSLVIVVVEYALSKLSFLRKKFFQPANLKASPGS